MMTLNDRGDTMTGFDGRSHAVTMVILTGYAVIAAMIVMRTVLVAFGATESVWMGRFVFGITGRATDVLEQIPGSTQAFIGPFSVIDLSLLGLVLLFPLGLVATSGTLKRRRQRLPAPGWYERG